MAAVGVKSWDKIVRAACALCLKNHGKYTCPRCNICYCSLDCYRCEKHVQCSESFYRECVSERLAEYAASPEERKKMLEVLKNLQCQEMDDVDSDDDEGDEPDLEERLRGLNLDTDTSQIWDRLTNAEQKEFRTMLQDGRLANLIEIWTPWWRLEEHRPVEEMIKKREAPGFRPSIKKNIPDINQLLTKSKPSADVKYSVINVLYAYVYIVRLHNGVPQDDPGPSAHEILHLSDVLRMSQSCGSVSEALHLCLQNIDTSLHSSQSFSISIIQDVLSIIEGPGVASPLDYCLVALSDLCSLLRKGQKTILAEHSSAEDNQHTSKIHRKLLFRARKKVEFLLSWVQRYGMALQDTAIELKLEFCALSNELSSTSSAKDKIEMARKSKKPSPAKEERCLVEELN